MSEQFENSIRKKLQDAETPFDPDAWEQMKKRLDDSGRRRPAFFWWMLSGLLVIVAAGGLWWWSQSSDQAVTEQRVAVTDSLPPASEDNSSPAGSVNNTVQIDRADRADNKNSRATQQVQQNGRQATVTHYQPSPVHTSAPDDQTNRSVISSDNAHISPDTSTSNNAGQSSRDGTVTAAVTTQPTQAPPDSTLPQQEDLPAKKKRKGFEGGITIGPDVNIASSMKMGRIGLGAGIILRYHFNDRWSVQTGAIFSKKLYGATPDDYHFDYPVTYTKIDADCNVLDVPLNVSYTFLEKKRNRWSAVAGASSYFMLNEKYDYFYANGTKRSHAYKSQNQHYFSVLNLGVNWERKTTSRLKWSLQPYVKVPLGGVGQGKVKLYSAGLALQVTMGKK